MDAINQLDDTDLRAELASLLGWHGIAKDARGVLTGKLPGVRSIVPLAIPKWTTNPQQVRGLEDSLERKGMMVSYTHNLILIRQDGGAGEWGPSQALAEATPRQRCEAALMTLRKAAVATMTPGAEAGD